MSRITHVVNLTLEFEVGFMLVSVPIKVNLETSIAQYKARKVKIKLRTTCSKRQTKVK